MIEIKCPACGAEGRASKEKIQTRLVCRKCLRVFHVTPSGKTVLGEPPAPGQTSTAVSRAKAAPDPGQKVDRLNPPQATRLQPVVRRVSPVGL